MIYVGIDPGVGGGIAVISYDDEHSYSVDVTAMPATEQDVCSFLRTYPASRTHAVIEHVWSIPGQGGAFKFGKNVGTLLGILTALAIPFDQVLPKAWQKTLGVVYRKGMTDVEKKNITKRRAQQLFPSLTVTHAIADSLLIAEYCRRVERGSVKPTAKRS